MSFKVIDRDHGYRRLLTTVRKWRQKVIRVGVSDAPHEGTPGLTIADVGAFHEFGSRSFLRAWVDQNQKDWMSWLRAGILGELLQGRQWASNFGRFAVRSIRERIRRGIPPELQEATVKRKERAGYSAPGTPLIATGQLIEGVEYEVER